MVSCHYSCTPGSRKNILFTTPCCTLHAMYWSSSTPTSFDCARMRPRTTTLGEFPKSILYSSSFFWPSQLLHGCQLHRVQEKVNDVLTVIGGHVLKLKARPSKAGVAQQNRLNIGQGDLWICAWSVCSQKNTIPAITDLSRWQKKRVVSCV